MSTTHQGNAFRDRVRKLIELTPGCHGIEAEKLIGAQVVDIYYEERMSFQNLRVACECKDYAEPLTMGYITREIYPRYYPLLENKLVDAVRIIAPQEVGEKAREYCRTAKFSFMTLSAMEAEVLDLRSYVTGLTQRYKQSGLPNYYVRPTLADGRDLSDVISAWLAGNSAQPVALLAGYGMGKSSFALHLASQTGESWLARQTARAPILIPLGDIATEQSLEGLLGKLFTARHRVDGYSFDLFLELNARGRFLVILDGFDEMKHTMSWLEFIHNFRELHQLVVPESRVLLLGRPSAFLSESEQQFVLRGKRKDGTYSVPGAPVYVELELAPFKVDDAVWFMEKYAAYEAPRLDAVRGSDGSAVDFASRIASIRSNPELSALATRPVQARMLADLALDPAVQWRAFSRYELYQQFLARIAQRELMKGARLRFQESDRELFQRQIAWWLWKRGAAPSFVASEVPAEFLPRPDDRSEALDSIRRDLLAGSVLERKSGDAYYFPHRSFMEFLVAQHLVTEGWSTSDLEVVATALNAEVAGFIRDSGRSDLVASWGAAINDVQGAVTLRFLELIAWARGCQGEKPPANILPNGTPRDVMTGYLAWTAESQRKNEAVRFLANAFIALKDPASRRTCLLALLLAEEADESALRELIRHTTCALLLREALPEMERIVKSQSRSVAADLRVGFMGHVTASFVNSAVGEKEILLGVSGEALFRSLQESLPVRWRLPDIESLAVRSFERLTIYDLATVDETLGLARSGGIVLEFFRRYPEPTKLVRVTAR